MARHTHPSSVSLLFAFDHAHAVRASREDTPTDTPTPTFFNARDWQRELDRLSVSNDQWRVSEANKHFLLCGRQAMQHHCLSKSPLPPHSLCPHFVCPSAVADSSLEAVACPHSGRRLPVSAALPHTLCVCECLLLCRCGAGPTPSLGLH